MFKDLIKTCEDEGKHETVMVTCASTAEILNVKKDDFFYYYHQENMVFSTLQQTLCQVL